MLSRGWTTNTPSLDASPAEWKSVRRYPMPKQTAQRNHSTISRSSILSSAIRTYLAKDMCVSVGAQGEQGFVDIVDVQDCETNCSLAKDSFKGEAKIWVKMRDVPRDFPRVPLRHQRQRQARAPAPHGKSPPGASASPNTNLRTHASQCRCACWCWEDTGSPGMP